jgi:hypothetical protein
MPENKNQNQTNKNHKNNYSAPLTSLWVGVFVCLFY